MYEDSDRKQNKKHIIDSIKMVLTREQIMTFVNGLHETQWEMIEALVSRRERQGFPEANEALKRIMEMK